MSNTPFAGMTNSSPSGIATNRRSLLFAFSRLISQLPMFTSRLVTLRSSIQSPSLPVALPISLKITGVRGTGVASNTGCGEGMAPGVPTLGSAIFFEGGADALQFAPFVPSFAAVNLSSSVASDFPAVS